MHAANVNRYWKDDIDDLRSRASVVTSTPAAAEKLSARTCARCMMGVISLVSRRWTSDLMQRTCAELVRDDLVWESSFGRLPMVNGLVSEPIQLIAVVARSLLPIAGADNVRAALSFWATEDDVGVWTSVLSSE